MHTLFSLFLTLFLIYPQVSHALTEDDLFEWDVIVTHIADGDTIDVRFNDGTEERVRILGMQAMEIHDSSDPARHDCHADEATQKISTLIGGVGAHVTLKIWDKTLRDPQRQRLWRYVFAKDDKGNEFNVAVIMIAEGHALAFPHQTETLSNKALLTAQQQAVAQKENLWDDDYCGTGPAQNTQLQMWVNWDAEGDDTQNVNGEWVKIRNNSTTDLDLTNWVLRESAYDYFYFPDNTMLHAGDTITVYIGYGTNSGNTFYWGNDGPIFGNDIGDGAYLFDPIYDANPNDGITLTGDIRSFFDYPCMYNCLNPLQGKITVKANYDADGDDSQNPNGEWVDIKNISTGDVNLEKYLLHSLPAGSATFHFDANSVIHPGETMRVYIGQGTGSRLTKYWGYSYGILTNSGDKVWIDTYDAIEIASHAWPESVAESEKFIIAPIIKLLTK